MRISPLLCVLFVLAASFGTAAVIYLTPLKWIPIVEPTISDIQPKDFYDAFQARPHDFLFVDVRPKSEYEQVHAKGAINIPLPEMYDKRHTLPKHGVTIVLICTAERSSGVAYSYLEHYGFRNLRRIDGGLTRWIAEGLPVEGKTPGWLQNHSDESSQTTNDPVQVSECPQRSPNKHV